MTRAHRHHPAQPPVGRPGRAAAHATRGPQPSVTRGLTLVELMIVLAMLAIVSAVALPSFREQILRSQLGDALTGLGDARALMEQHFLDQRTYSGGPCTSARTAGSFSIACMTLPGPSSYTISATGAGVAAGFTYTIDHHGSQRTTALPSRWGSVPSGGYPCWITRQGNIC